MNRLILSIVGLLLIACGSSPTSAPTPEPKDPERIQDTGSSLVDGATPIPDVTPIPDAGSQPPGTDAAPMMDAAPNSPDSGSPASIPDSGSPDSNTPSPDCTPLDTKCEGLVAFTCGSGSIWKSTQCPFLCSDGACVGVCNTGDSDCQGLVPRVCGSSGAWVQKPACSFVCEAGSCTGACVPGDRDCSGQNPRSCNQSGAWVNETACGFVCGGEGMCSGSCSPTAKDCQGNVPRTCDQAGAWQSGSACPYVCGGAGVCQGVCTPSATRCNGNGSETCNASGQWVLNQTCPFVCSGAGVCSGACSPTTKQCSGTTPQTCDGSGAWQSGSACSFVCQAGTCGGVCTPGDRDCSGLIPRSCSAQGQWVAETACQFICGGEGVCSGSCSPTAKQCSGTTPQTCSAGGQWVSGSVCPYVCGSGTCGGVCVPGTKQCSGALIQTCNGSGQWDTAIACGAVQGATVTCDSGTKACIATCTGTNFDCDLNMANGCEVDVSSNKDNCGVCGHSCCGGACGSGVCGVYDTGVYGIYEVDANNLYSTYNPAVGTTTLVQQPRTGGAATTVITVSGGTDRTVINSVRSNGTTLFWSQQGLEYSTGLPVTGAILSVPVAGTGSSTLQYTNAGGPYTVISTHGLMIGYGNLQYFGDLTLDATHLILNYNSGSSVQWVDLTAPLQLVSNSYSSSTGIVNSISFPSNVTSVISDDNYLYAVGGFTGMYRATINSSSAAAWITSTKTYPNSLATDKSNVYYRFFDAVTPANNGIWKKAVAGASSTQIIADSYVRAQMATDGSFVYYNTSVNGTTTTLQFKRVSVNGGTAKLITTTTNTNVTNFKVIDQCLYWQEGGFVRASAVSP